MQINFARSLAVAVITSAVAMSGVLASPFQQDDDGVIEGFVFLDDDGDGVLDIAEVGVDGIIVRLEGAEKAETETDAAGGYRFGGLQAGKYDVTVEAGEDYATAELDSYRGLVLQKDGDRVETLGDVNFALRDADMEAATTADEDGANASDDDAADKDADATDEGADADAADADSEDADTEDADGADSEDDESMNADEADAADDEDAAGGSTAAMSLLLTQMIGDMSGEDADGELRASLEAALASAEADGTDNEMTAAIEQALAAMDADADEDADAEDGDEAAGGDEDADGDMDEDGEMDDDADDEGDHEDADADDSAMGHGDGSGHDGDMASAGAMTKGGMAVDMTGGGPADMPDTGAGGPVSIALLLMLALGMVAVLGRGMERRLGA
jgi:hypothetical protein